MTPMLDFAAAVSRSHAIERGQRVPARTDLKSEKTEIAKGMEAFWRERGFPGARFTVEVIREWAYKSGHILREYGIRSNLVNGIPPR
jgi:hypothetical protein